MTGFSSVSIPSQNPWSNSQFLPFLHSQHLINPDILTWEISIQFKLLSPHCLWLVFLPPNFSYSISSDPGRQSQPLIEEAGVPESELRHDRVENERRKNEKLIQRILGLTDMNKLANVGILSTRLLVSFQVSGAIFPLLPRVTTN